MKIKSDHVQGRQGPLRACKLCAACTHRTCGSRVWAHQASKSSRDRPLCSMEGVAMTTLAPTPSSARALATCFTCLNTKGLAACAHFVLQGKRGFCFLLWCGLHELRSLLSHEAAQLQAGHSMETSTHQQSKAVQTACFRLLACLFVVAQARRVPLSNLAVKVSHVTERKLLL